ncbi:MAG: sensor histidine kinase [Beutenbergiaceae bacterium]
MNPNWLLIVVALVGVAVGAVGVAAFRYSEWVQRRARPGSAVAVGEDVAAVLAALRETSIILGADDEVLRASPDAYGLGLVRHGQRLAPELADLVALVRSSGRAQSRTLDIAHSALPGSDHGSFDLAVAPLSGARVLILAQDATARERLTQVRRDFVANVSHELKTPVGALSLLAQTLADAADDPAAVQHFSRQMQTEAARLSSLVQDIIDLSRLQAPETETVLVDLDVEEIVTEAVDRARVGATARNAQIVVGGDSGLRIYGDHALLVTALRNLLDNAIGYSPDGATVRIGIRRREGVVEIAVVDQGVGIGREEAERVFERFYRVDPARARDTGGTGLGLSIVKHVAARHGGQVRLWSVPGRGSTFTLRLPQAPSSEAEEVPNDPHPGG